MALFKFFLRYGSQILHTKFQVILTKNEGVTLIFPIQNEIKIRKNHSHISIFDQKLNFHPGLFSSNFHHQGGFGATCK